MLAAREDGAPHLLDSGRVPRMSSCSDLALPGHSEYMLEIHHYIDTIVSAPKGTACSLAWAKDDSLKC